LALIRIDEQNLPALPFADSDQLRWGDLVFAVGALVESHGRLIGLRALMVSKSGGNEGINFAVPSNLVRNVYGQLRAKGSVSRGSVGLFAQNITPVLARGLSRPVSRGVVLADIDANGPVDRGRIKRRDVILSVNGQSVRSSRQVEITSMAGGAPKKLQSSSHAPASDGTPLWKLPRKARPSTRWPLASPAKNLVRRLGILCIEIDQHVAKLMPDLRRQYGLVVAAKSPKGRRNALISNRANVIHVNNNFPVVSLAAFQEDLKELQPGDVVALQIERDARLHYVAFEIE
jgi:serine protease Do